jgi:tRNA1Val (adenine37-N6)-methyltransferase
MKLVKVKRMPQSDFEKEKLEPLGGGYYAVTSKSHTFGADAILLADFAEPRSAKRLCDLCAGCGIVSLLWSADGVSRRIDAIEIQSEAVRLIKSAALKNSLAGITAIEADLRTLDASFSGAFDLVACNPPYKKSGTGAMSIDRADRAARHETLCTLEDVVSAGFRLLRGGGRLCLCHRPERLADLITLMCAYKVEPKRLRFVQQRADTKPWLVLVEGKKCSKPGILAEPAFIVEDKNGGYSREMSEIYNKFNH